MGASRMIPLNSYLTDDPLDLETRPQAAGSAMRADDGGAPPPKALPAVSGSIALTLPLVHEEMREVVETSARFQAAIVETNARFQAAVLDKMDAMVRQDRRPVVVNEIKVPAAEPRIEVLNRVVLPDHLTVDIGKVPVTRTRVLKRGDKGIEETETVTEE